LSSCSPKQKGSKQERMAATLDQSIVAHKIGWPRCGLTALPNKKGKRWERMAAGQKSIGHKKQPETGKGGQEAVDRMAKLSPKQKGRRQERMATAWD